MPQKQRKKQPLGQSANGCAGRRAEHKDYVGAWDVIFDRTRDGRPTKWMSIVHEYTQECLALEVDRSITANRVIDVLAELLVARGVPRNIRSDNEPEFIAAVIRECLGHAGLETLSIQPGSPWENGCPESFHARLRDELLTRKEFDDLRKAWALGTARWLKYNHRRPHSALGY